jgi:carbon-monoxide dehydrogenase medium subunit
MKPPRFEYYAPVSLAEAVAIKAEIGDEAFALAGGQSLVPLLNMRLARPAALIDLNRIPDLQYVRERDNGIAVGAMTRQRQLERSEMAQLACPLVGEALESLAHTIIRNRGTVGGSIAHGDPAAELPAVVVALGGTVTALGPQGERIIPAEEFFLFHLTTALRPDELVTEIWLPRLARGTGWAFLEVSRRHGDFALAGVAALVFNGTSRLAFLGVGPRPILVETEDPDQAAGSVDPTSDIHANADYRRELVRTLTRRAVAIARERSGQGVR